MEVKAVSFTGKTPKTIQVKSAYKKAMEEVLGQSDKDYFAITKKQNSQPNIKKDNFIERAKKFFRGFLEQ